MEAAVAPVLQTKVLVPVPPVAEAVAVPLEPPKQLTGVKVMLATTAVGATTVAVAVAVQLLKSVAVTV